MGGSLEQDISNKDKKKDNRDLIFNIELYNVERCCNSLGLTNIYEENVEVVLS